MTMSTRRRSFFAGCAFLALGTASIAVNIRAITTPVLIIGIGFVFLGGLLVDRQLATELADIILGRASRLPGMPPTADVVAIDEEEELPALRTAKALDA